MNEIANETITNVYARVQQSHFSIIGRKKHKLGSH